VEVVMSYQVLIPVSDESQIGEARRAALRLAASEQLNETDSGRVGIVTTELATNLVRHARGGGSILLTGRWRGTAEAGVEVLAIDRGPGMSNLNRCFVDGFSTGGTAGHGLGAVRRMSDQSDVFSSTEGTVLWARVGVASNGTSPRAGATLAWGCVSEAAPGEQMCGDGWRLSTDGDRLTLMVVDGLGHGPLAAAASEEAGKLFDRGTAAAGPGAFIEAAHAALSRTRGAALAIASLDVAAGKLIYAGVGNIAGTLLSGPDASRGLFSHNGTVGHLVRKVQEFEYPWTSASVLVMHSDGLQTRWDLSKYPGLIRRHPAVIAGVLYRDFKRGRDDVTVVVVSRFDAGM
jgi:anti-sigma regulatory factor (Ser/Thr protein kinase)